jgi:hypothetical protein
MARTPDVGPCRGDALRDEDGEALLNMAWTWYGAERVFDLTKT